MTVSSVVVIPRADLGIVISSYPESGFPYLEVVILTFNVLDNSCVGILLGVVILRIPLSWGSPVLRVIILGIVKITTPNLDSPILGFSWIFFL